MKRNTEIQSQILTHTLTHMSFCRGCLEISGMNGNEGYWGGGISTIRALQESAKNFSPKTLFWGSPKIFFTPKLYHLISVPQY
jgi:hypothetical protein